MKTCEFCDQPSVARGWCSKHYDTWKRNGNPLLLKKQKVKGTVCLVAECGKEARSRGLCGTHYARWHKWGSTDLHPNVGSSSHPLYGTWRSVKNRWCCSEWADFRAFVADVGDRPGPFSRIVPLDESRPLSADNHRWTTPAKRQKRDGVWKKPASKRWAESNAEKRREAMLRFRFNITSAEYDALLAKQRGRRGICTEKPKRRRLAVDHCHHSGAIRGLLCQHCNTALGNFRDDPDLLGRAIDYLREAAASE